MTDMASSRYPSLTTHTRGQCLSLFDLCCCCSDLIPSSLCLSCHFSPTPLSLESLRPYVLGYKPYTTPISYPHSMHSVVHSLPPRRLPHLPFYPYDSHHKRRFSDCIWCSRPYFISVVQSRAVGCTCSVAPYQLMPLLRPVTEVRTRKCAELTLKLDKNPNFKAQGLTLPYGMDIDILIPYFVLHAGRDDRQKGPYVRNTLIRSRHRLPPIYSL